jgi:hypothetical protein
MFSDPPAGMGGAGHRDWAVISQSDFGLQLANMFGQVTYLDSWVEMRVSKSRCGLMGQSWERSYIV